MFTIPARFQRLYVRAPRYGRQLLPILKVTVPLTDHKSYGLEQSLKRRKAFSTSVTTHHGHWKPPGPGEEINVTFIDKDGDEHKIAANKGDTLLSVAQGNDIEMEGACEGSCSCSTCHVVVESEEIFNRIPEATDDENDMLDLAFGLTETSRLGCQIELTKELDGIRVRLPSRTRNLQASDFSS
ncbi:hypothetical protein K3495_g5843 [Podosphaera aphanis]|nr:hypothetical protein K3495_g5843 [Podosphaera aphanis]